MLRRNGPVIKPWSQNAEIIPPKNALKTTKGKGAEHPVLFMTYVYEVR